MRLGICKQLHVGCKKTGQRGRVSYKTWSMVMVTDETFEVAETGREGKRRGQRNGGEVEREGSSTSQANVGSRQGGGQQRMEEQTWVAIQVEC